MNPVGNISPSSSGARLRLLGGFLLTLDGVHLDLPTSAARLVAFLGLQPHPVPRAYVAGALWGDRSESRAAACLRSAIWRTNSTRTPPLIVAGRSRIALHERILVDVHGVLDVAHAQLRGAAEPVAPELLAGELLPGWYDEWVLAERERLRQMCLEAIEQMAESLLGRDQVHLAIEAALTVVATEPLRESAYRVLIESYLRAGNRGEALRQFERCRRILLKELGLLPGKAMLIAAEGVLHEMRPTSSAALTPFPSEDPFPSARLERLP